MTGDGGKHVAISKGAGFSGFPGILLLEKTGISMANPTSKRFQVNRHETQRQKSRLPSRNSQW
ncbi:MAG: hypothetical protein ACOY3X_01080 [Pseudomonadota bacterium]